MKPGTAILISGTIILACAFCHGKAQAAVTQDQIAFPALCGSLGEVRSLVEKSGSKFIARGRLDNGKMIFYYINTEGPALQILFPVENEYCLTHNVKVDRLEVNRSAALGLFVD